MKENNNSNLPSLAIVAIVLIVGIVALVSMKSDHVHSAYVYDHADKSFESETSVNEIRNIGGLAGKAPTGPIPDQILADGSAVYGNLIVPAAQGPAAEGGVVTPSSQDATVDVLMIYTTDLKNSLGGKTATEAVLQTHVDWINGALENSLLGHRVAIAKMHEVDYYHEEVVTDLFRVKTDDDGYMDEVHALREEYGADVVTLYVHTGWTWTQGASYLMSTGWASSNFAPAAFNVVALNDLNQAEALEKSGQNMGNLFGCTSQRDLNYPPGVYDYAYAYRNEGSNGQPRSPHFGTLGNLGSLPTSWTTLQQYSNPDVLYSENGFYYATGVDIAEPRAAHCALAFDSTIPIVADFREKMVSIVSPPDNTAGPLSKTITYEIAQGGNVKFYHDGIMVHQTFHHDGDPTTESGSGSYSYSFSNLNVGSNELKITLDNTWSDSVTYVGIGI